jgi:sporulation protein YlmC with PRC-barrel domain
MDVNKKLGDMTGMSDYSKAPRRLLSASTLAGDRVYNQVGEDLGKVDDLMIDTVTGRVGYAVLSFGGFLGMGDKLFAVPWRALNLDQQNHRFILNVAKETLENAPGFDKDNWPDMTNQDWESQIHKFYGIEWSRSQPYDENIERTNVAGRRTGY